MISPHEREQLNNNNNNDNKECSLIDLDRQVGYLEIKAVRMKNRNKLNRW